MRRSLRTLAGVFVALTARPLAAEVVTLPALERTAVQNRPALAIDAARTTGAQAEVDKARSAYYPRISAQAQSLAAPGRSLLKIPYKNEVYLVSGSKELTEGPSAFAPQIANQLDLALEGPIYDFGRTRAAVAAGRARFASVEAEEQATRAAIVENVRGAYLAWLSATELYAIAEQAATDSENRRTRIEGMIEEGVRPHAELTPAKADEMLAKLELERARGDRDAAKLELDHAVGQKLAEDAEPDRSLLERDVEVTAPPSDPALHALEQQHAAANASAHAQGKLDSPVLSATALAGLRAQGTTPFPMYAVGVNLNVPLWDGGEAKAAASIARAHADELTAQIHDHEAQRDAGFERAQLDARSALARLATARALLEVCEQRKREAEESYELGAGTLDQLAQAQALLRRARTEVVLARVARADANLRMLGPEASP